MRILAPTVTPGRIQGTVMEMDEKTLLLSTEDNVRLRVSRQAITRLDVSVGRRRHARQGLIVGAVFGGALGALMPIESDLYCSQSTPTAARPCSLGISRSELFAAALVGYAASGAAIGHWAIKTDRWSPVPRERIRISVAPTRGRGLALCLALRF